LHIQACPVTDLEPLRGAPIRELYIYDSKVSDLGPLRGMPLQKVELFDTSVVDISPLENSPIRVLSILAGGLEDLSPVSKMPLDLLNVGRNRIRDLSPLAGMKLQNLVLDQNMITDISSLAGLPLAELSVGDNRISDLSPLRGMPLRELRVSQNELTDLSPLAGMPLDFLDVGGNPLPSLAPFVDDPPPRFLFMTPSLSAKELKRAIEQWADKPELAGHLRQAHLLLAIKQDGPTGLRRFADTKDGRILLFVPMDLGWEEAVALARDAGGHLASVRADSDIRTFATLTGILPDSTFVNMYRGNDGVMRDADGTELSYVPSLDLQVIQSNATLGPATFNSGETGLKLMPHGATCYLIIEWDDVR
jgi:hypothetical protein